MKLDIIGAKKMRGMDALVNKDVFGKTEDQEVE